MNRTMIGLAVTAALALAAASVGADAPPKKLYRWVDRDGKVQFSDSLPPEAIDQARTELSATSGRATAVVDRALTPEEREAQETQERLAAQERDAAEKARETEHAMLASFQTENDLRHSFKIRQELLNQTLEAIEAGIAGQRDSLASLLLQASEAELAGTAVGKKQADTIRELHVEIGKQQQMLVLKQAELVDLDGDLERLLVRFRELRDGTSAPGTAPATPDATAPAAEAPVPEASTPAG